MDIAREAQSTDGVRVISAGLPLPLQHLGYFDYNLRKLPLSLLLFLQAKTEVFHGRTASYRSCYTVLWELELAYLDFTPSNHLKLT